MQGNTDQNCNDIGLAKWMFYDVLDHLDPLCARGHMGLQSTDARRPLTGEVNVQKKQNAILLHTSFCIINYAATAC